MKINWTNSITETSTEQFRSTSASSRRNLTSSSVESTKLVERPTSNSDDDIVSDFDVVARSLKGLTLALDDVAAKEKVQDVRGRHSSSIRVPSVPKARRRRTFRYAPYSIRRKRGNKKLKRNAQSIACKSLLLLPYSVNLLTKLSGALDSMDLDLDSAFFLGLPALSNSTRKMINSKTSIRNTTNSDSSSCSSQARSSTDVTVGELAAYFDEYMHLPKKMSQMAEMMYT